MACVCCWLGSLLWGGEMAFWDTYCGRAGGGEGKGKGWAACAWEARGVWMGGRVHATGRRKQACAQVYS